jgi:hypothetical protein
VALALLAIGLPGCVTGHLLDAARRREHPVAITAAGLEGDRLLVRYTAEVTDDTGDGVGTTEAAAALPLSQLRTPASPAADALAPDWIAPARVARGEPVVVARGTASRGDACAGRTLEVIEKDGRDVALVWRDGGATPPWAPVPIAALTRQRTAPWVWPLMPPAVAVDGVVGPILLFFVPAVMVVSE